MKLISLLNILPSILLGIKRPKLTQHGTPPLRDLLCSLRPILSLRKRAQNEGGNQTNRVSLGDCGGGETGWLDGNVRSVNKKGIDTDDHDEGARVRSTEIGKGVAVC